MMIDPPRERNFYRISSAFNSFFISSQLHSLSLTYLIARSYDLFVKFLNTTDLNLAALPISILLTSRLMH